MKKTLIKSIGNANAEGISLELTEPAALTSSGMKATQWFVSWDKIGNALFGDQYLDAPTVVELNEQRKGTGK